MKLSSLTKWLFLVSRLHYEIQIWVSVKLNTQVKSKRQRRIYHAAAAAAAAAKSLHSCPILCDPRDGSPPGSPILGILQARTLEWVAISSSNA